MGQTTPTALNFDGKTVCYHIKHCCRVEGPGRIQKQVRDNLQRAAEHQGEEEASAELQGEEGASPESGRSEEANES